MSDATAVLWWRPRQHGLVKQVEGSRIAYLVEDLRERHERLLPPDGDSSPSHHLRTRGISPESSRPNAPPAPSMLTTEN